MTPTVTSCLEFIKIYSIFLSLEYTDSEYNNGDKNKPIFKKEEEEKNTHIRFCMFLTINNNRQSMFFYVCLAKIEIAQKVGNVLLLSGQIGNFDQILLYFIELNFGMPHLWF